MRKLFIHQPFFRIISPICNGIPSTTNGKRYVRSRLDVAVVLCYEKRERHGDESDNVDLYV